MEYYIVNGYRPYEDILFTFDDLDGNISSEILEMSGVKQSFLEKIRMKF